MCQDTSRSHQHCSRNSHKPHILETILLLPAVQHEVHLRTRTPGSLRPHKPFMPRSQLTWSNISQHPQVDRSPGLRVENLSHNPSQIRPQCRTAQLADPMRVFLRGAVVFAAVLLMKQNNTSISSAQQNLNPI
jgi:hypothetical protein